MCIGREAEQGPGCAQRPTRPGPGWGRAECGLAGWRTHPREDGEEGEGDDGPGPRLSPRSAGCPSGSETCHWLARKQKPTNQKEGPEGWGGHRARLATWAERERVGRRMREKTEEPGRFKARPTLPTHRGEEVGGQSARSTGKHR